MFSDLAPYPIGDCPSMILLAHTQEVAHVGPQSGDSGYAEAGCRARKRGSLGDPHAEREPGSKGARGSGGQADPSPGGGNGHHPVMRSELDRRLNNQAARLAHVFVFDTLRYRPQILPVARILPR